MPQMSPELMAKMQTPEMMRSMQSMMKSMPAEQLSAMMGQSGVTVTPEQAEQMKTQARTPSPRSTHAHMRAEARLLCLLCLEPPQTHRPRVRCVGFSRIQSHPKHLCCDVRLADHTQSVAARCWQADRRAASGRLAFSQLTLRMVEQNTMWAGLMALKGRLTYSCCFRQMDKLSERQMWWLMQLATKSQQAMAAAQRARAYLAANPAIAGAIVLALVLALLRWLRFL